MIVDITDLLAINTTELPSDIVMVMVHGADGSIASFCELAKRVNCRVLAIQYDADTMRSCTTIEAFAEMYLKQLQVRCPDQMDLIYLGGHSFGGLVAYEMANLLRLSDVQPNPVIMLDPNLPLAMRNYDAERLLELRVLSMILLPSQMMQQEDILQADEETLSTLLSRCVKRKRIEEILAARKHCLLALSHYDYRVHPNIETDIFHAGEKFAFDFTDQDTRVIQKGTVVNGNHFTMLEAQNVKDIAAVINEKIGCFV
ncbi:MAG: hypothetical protein K0U37_08270 [Gammaproteobacteria bacterium]|nr:hypothetical protein [Gammaproteobacteria bacterium]